MRRAPAFAAAILAALSAMLCPAGPAHADVAGADSVYLVGEFVDPVCIFQHGMQGTAQRTCAMVRGRVDQGIYFLDVRGRELYAVIGQTHFEDPNRTFLELLGDTVAVSGRVWDRLGSRALAVARVWPAGSQPAPRYRWWPWSWNLSTLAGCGLAAILYLLAIGPWRRRLGAPAGSRPELGRAASFLASLVVVLVSLNGPMHDLSDLYLFSAHMVQHLLLAQAFPPLLLLGIPPWLAARLLEPRASRAVWGALTRVPVGFALYTVVFSIWHVPALYNLMMRDHGFHIVMHLMVMASAVLLWWPILAPAGRRLAPGAQMLYLFLLGVPMIPVAAFITMADRALYEWYALAPRLWGLSAVDDQRTGGLIMWVPGVLVYWGFMTAVWFRWAMREEARAAAERPLPAGP